MFSNSRWLTISIFLVVFISGCATMRELPTPSRKEGVYHKVAAGETLWRIAKAYSIGIDELIRSNNIPNVAHVEENQLIFIPEADQIRAVVADQEDAPNKDEFAWPVQGKVIGYFGEKRRGYLDQGIAVQAEPGQAVCASREGRVVFADYLSGYTYTVILDHADGYLSIYSHNAEIFAKVGALVLKGDKIAQVGDGPSGAFSYFEVRKDGRARNPLYYLPKM